MLVGEKVILRPFEREDMERALKWINDREIMRLTGVYRPISLDRQKLWYEDLLRRNDTFIYSIIAKGDGEFIGTCGLYDIHWQIRKADLRIRIGERNYWHKGYGAESVKLLISFAFKDLNLHRVGLEVFENNVPAIRLYEKCGFVREGILRDAGFVNGNYVNVIVMSIINEEN
ncbi:MAG: GNAT family N-acetyltransferase [bacterium]